MPDPPEVALHDVPVRLRDLDLLAAGAGAAVGSGAGAAESAGCALGGLPHGRVFDDLDEDFGCGGDGGGWDLGLRMILPHIDGISHVQAIAERADVDVGVVRSGLRHLLYYGLVAMVDVFQFRNVYAATHRVQNLLHSPQLRRACMLFVSADDVQMLPSSQQPPAARSRPTFEFVFQLLAAFGAGARVGDLNLRFGAPERGIDVRRLAVFGVLHGLLRRIHRFIVPVARDPSSLAPAPPPQPPLTPALVRSLDGSTHIEALCCRLRASEATLEAALLLSGFILVDR